MLSLRSYLLMADTQLSETGHEKLAQAIRRASYLLTAQDNHIEYLKHRETVSIGIAVFAGFCAGLFAAGLETVLASDSFHTFIHRVL